MLYLIFIFFLVFNSASLHTGVNKPKPVLKYNYVYSTYKPPTASQRAHYVDLANRKVEADGDVVKKDLDAIRNADTVGVENFYKEKMKVDNKQWDKDVDTMLYWEGQT